MERIKGLSEVKVLKIKEAAAKMMVTMKRISHPMPSANTLDSLMRAAS